MIRAFLKFWFTNSHKDWLALRRECMAVLPKQAKRESLEENGQ